METKVILLFIKAKNMNIQVSGEVRAVLGNNLRAGNIWEGTELPRLKANTKVTKITIIDPETMIETVIFTR
jgi:hypothetical protein